MLRVPHQLAAYIPLPGCSAAAPVYAEKSNAIELATGGHFTNYGHISTGPSTRFKESYSGISANSAASIIVNHGAVAGGSNGIKATDDVTLINHGVIIGHKGAGLKSKGNADVVNYRIIRGADAQRSKENDGDGDGLDIDKRARVHNYGLIEGTGANGADKNGAPNTSEGIAMGGGEIYNRGVIRGAHHGVLVDDGDLGPAYGSTSLINEGIITGRNGYGVRLIGEHNDQVTNDGLISGTKGIALDMGGGDDVLTVRGNAQFNGKVDGGSGTNHVVLDDVQGGTFNGARRIQHLWIDSGSWTLDGALDANQQGRVSRGATLINQSHIGGTMTIDAGATYTAGTVTNLDVAGTLLLDPALKSQTRIKHDLDLANGSTLAFTLGMGEAHSTLKVGNSARLKGTTLNIQVEHENDELLTRQLRVIDAAQIEGRFNRITSNLKTLTPRLIYTPSGVFVSFRRNPSTEA